MNADERTIRDIVGQLESAWNAKDSAAFAAPFAEDANFIHIYGGQMDGRAAIEASHRRIFDTVYKGTRAEFTVRSVRFLRADAAIVFTKAQVAGGDALVEARPTLIVVKDGGEWRIAAFQNTRISEMPAAAGDARRQAS